MLVTGALVTGALPRRPASARRALTPERGRFGSAAEGRRGAPARGRARGRAGRAAAAERSPGEALALLQIEVALEMSCGKCVAGVEEALRNVPGVVSYDVSLERQAATVQASCESSAVVDAIQKAGFAARAIGFGNANAATLLGAADGGAALAERLGTDLRTLKQSLAAVAEFKGEPYGHGSVTGVVRFVQVDESAAVVEAHLEGLRPNGSYDLTVRVSGDTTAGVASAGGVHTAVFMGAVASPTGNLDLPPQPCACELRTWDVIGRAFAVVPTGGADAATAATAVLARSALTGENSAKRICACDGTVLWEA